LKGSGVSVLVRNKKLPLNLVKEAFSHSTTKGERLLQVETFGDTFGPGSRRKRPALASTSLADMLMKADDKFDDYDDANDGDYHKWDIKEAKDAVQHAIFSKG
jgi:nuclear GTP-binding protein